MLREPDLRRGKKERGGDLGVGGYRVYNDGDQIQSRTTDEGVSNNSGHRERVWVQPARLTPHTSDTVKGRQGRTLGSTFRRSLPLKFLKFLKR